MKTYTLYDYLDLEEFYLTQEYGTNKYQNYTKYGLLWHEGEDYGDRNDPKPIVRALHDGIVVRDEDTPKDNYGNYVVLWDDVQQCATWYCHLAQNSVGLGQRVKAGDVIGIMGSTGNVSGKHLHLNFVLTDANGARLYNTKPQNLGFLDPHSKVFPPNVPQYKVQWLKPGASMPEETMTITREDFEKIRGNSEKWDSTVRYLEVTDDPATTPFDRIKSIVAGLKSRLTDIGNQLTTAISEVSNREEQVSRLKVQLLNEAKAQKDALIAEKKKLEIAELQQAQAEARAKVLQGEVDQMAKDKGTALNEKAIAETSAKEWQDKYNTLLAGQPVQYSVLESLQLLLKAIKKGKG